MIWRKNPVPRLYIKLCKKKKITTRNILTGVTLVHFRYTKVWNWDYAKPMDIQPFCTCWIRESSTITKKWHSPICTGETFARINENENVIIFNGNLSLFFFLFLRIQLWRYIFPIFQLYLFSTLQLVFFP